MIMRLVKSSNIKEVGYDKNRLVLRVQFHESTDEDASIYEYAGIAPSLFRKLMAAKSIAAYFSRYIKPRNAGIEIVFHDGYGPGYIIAGPYRFDSPSIDRGRGSFRATGNRSVPTIVKRQPKGYQSNEHAAREVVKHR